MTKDQSPVSAGVWRNGNDVPKADGIYIARRKIIRAVSNLEYVTAAGGWNTSYPATEIEWLDETPVPDTNVGEIKALVKSAEEILHLHMCEQEGLSSGQPTRTQWLEAVGNLSNALSNLKNKQPCNTSTTQ